MKLRSVVLAMCGMLFFAFFSFAEEPRGREEPEWGRRPGTPTRLEWSGFEVRLTLPHGWTLLNERRFAPPAGLASSCSVRGEFYTANWNAVVATALRASEGMRKAAYPRTLHKLGGHQAVTNRYGRGGRSVVEVYVDLSDVRADSGAVWTFEGSPTEDGRDCELQFLALIHSANISRLP